MLFDLQGKRRRVVQATYLTLAILMGGGLVLFGVGSDVSGGLFDIFSDNKGGGNGNGQVEKRIERDNARLKRNPRDEATLRDLVRANYQLAGSQGSASQSGFPPEAKPALNAAGRAWERYLALEPKKLDTSLATVALQIYDPTALNRPKEAEQAARIIAEADPSPQAYLRLVQYAALAGDKRTADLAGDKVVELAPKSQRKEAEQAVKQAKMPQQQGGSGSGQAPVPAPGG
ncbi:MAG TPA: hypothetical protein VK304_01650 [Thermoleophilaceae bacterium]|nr:hypothetical protein [Thermoleophilaceae bacterium]